MSRFDFGCRGLPKLSVGIRQQPGRSERAKLPSTNFGEKLLFIFCIRRILCQSQIGHLLYWAIALGAPDHRAVRHDATMAFRAGYLANLQFAPLSNDLSCERAHATFVIQVTRLRGKGTHPLSTVGLWAEEERRGENHFPGLDPGLLSHQLGTMGAIIP